MLPDQSGQFAMTTRVRSSVTRTHVVTSASSHLSQAGPDRPARSVLQARRRASFSFRATMMKPRHCTRANSRRPRPEPTLARAAPCRAAPSLSALPRPCLPSAAGRPTIPAALPARGVIGFGRLRPGRHARSGVPAQQARQRESAFPCFGFVRPSTRTVRPRRASWSSIPRNRRLGPRRPARAIDLALCCAVLRNKPAARGPFSSCALDATPLRSTLRSA